MKGSPELEPLDIYFNIFSAVTIVFGIILGMIIASTITSRAYDTGALITLGLRLFTLAVTVLGVMQLGVWVIVLGFKPLTLQALIFAAVLIYVQPLGERALLTSAPIWYVLMITWTLVILVVSIGLRVAVNYRS